MNRAILHTLQWLTSERRIAYYLYLLRETLWPDGRWAPDPPRTLPEQSAARRARLAEMLDDLIARARPVIGDAIADRARDDVIGVIQHKALNKHFLFVALDVVLAHIFPEMVTASALPYISTAMPSAATASAASTGGDGQTSPLATAAAAMTTSSPVIEIATSASAPVSMTAGGHAGMSTASFFTPTSTAYRAQFGARRRSRAVS